MILLPLPSVLNCSESGYTIASESPPRLCFALVL